MPQTPHVEHHFTGGATVRDVVIGMSDGLTVPFALAAGLSGAVAAARIVVTAGLAEVAAGSIAMGLGGYLAARSDAEHYASELAREEREIVEMPDAEAQEVNQILQSYGVTANDAGVVVRSMRQRPETWRDFMMRFELGLEAPDPKRALRSALTIAASYVVGGLVPLVPYMAVKTVREALGVSLARVRFAVPRRRCSSADWQRPRRLRSRERSVDDLRATRSKCVRDRGDVDHFLQKRTERGHEESRGSCHHCCGTQAETEPDAFPCDRHHAFADRDRVADSRKVVGEDHHISCFGRDPAAVARQRDADIGRGECRRVIGAITHHQHVSSLARELANDAYLAVGKEVAMCLADPGQLRDGAYVGRVIAGEKNGAVNA
jgi:VIT1/CCC1 family predicted Fe2+/Mn2+ transporter